MQFQISSVIKIRILRKVFKQILLYQMLKTTPPDCLIDVV